MTDLMTDSKVGFPRHARGARTLSGYIRRRLRVSPHITRVDLRAWLRRDRLLTWGTRGNARLMKTLRRMAADGELALAGASVVALDLRRRRTKARPRPRASRPARCTCPIRSGKRAPHRPQIGAMG